ncbi:Cytosol aminopeptidase [Nymphon striatum]|nr:Cytosol aminopeptidase [Nymphon striatum]
MFKKGLVLGIYENEKKNGYELTETGKKFDAKNDNNLSKQLHCMSSTSLKKGSSQLLYGLGNEFQCVSIVNLGSSSQGVNEQEQWNELKQNIRTVASVGSRALRDQAGVTSIEIDSCGEPEAAAEGCILGLYSYDELKTKKKKKVDTSLCKFESGGKDDWIKGVIKAEAQNIARNLTNAPANHMTPKIFSENVEKLFKGKKNVEVKIRNKEWAAEMKMGSYLSVAQGSEEPPYFVEVHYRGATSEEEPVLLVGKGITFDSGGISLKPPNGMLKMRADMGGAACVIGTLHAIAELQIPVNVIGLTPMTENMINGKATKPGDVFTAMNGKTIQVDNTDAEGRLVLADALCYAHTFHPRVILDMATLTGAVGIALGCGAAGVFTTSDKLFKVLHDCSIETGDRVWRLPMFESYGSQLKKSTVADLNNIAQRGVGGGASVAAAFLKEFVEISEWLHLDVSGVKENTSEVPYLGKGFTGRPVRTIVDFISKLSQKDI